MYRILEGQRSGSTIFEHENFEYRKEKGATRLYLKCTERTCRGRAIIDGETISVKTAHNYLPHHPFYFKINAAKTSMKRAAKQSASHLKDIYDDTCREMGIGGEISYYNVESTLRKRRRKTFPGIPQTTRDAADCLTHAGPELSKYTTNFM